MKHPSVLNNIISHPFNFTDPSLIVIHQKDAKPTMFKVELKPPQNRWSYRIIPQNRWSYRIILYTHTHTQQQQNVKCMNIIVLYFPKSLSITLTIRATTLSQNLIKYIRFRNQNYIWCNSKVTHVIAMEFKYFDNHLGNFEKNCKHKISFSHNNYYY